jgi:hypothetical protein
MCVCLLGSTQARRKKELPETRHTERRGQKRKKEEEARREMTMIR